MTRTIATRLLLVASTTAILAATRVSAVEVYKQQFDPPRVYFTHANVNKDGYLTAIKGQDNFLSLYFPGIDREKVDYEADGFSFIIHLPAFVEVLDADEMNLACSTTTSTRGVQQKVEGVVDAAGIEQRCFRGFWGVDLDLWYRVDGAPPGVTAEPVRIDLLYKGKKCFSSEAKMRVHEALEVPRRIDPQDFRFWQHYGPHFREGRWDALAGYLGKAGFNAMQFTLGKPNEESTKRIQEMRQRGFYIIAQRVGSYSSAANETRRVLSLGTEWFEQADAGCMHHYLPFVDAALWDFEPKPERVLTDDWTLSEFRAETGISSDERLTKELVKAKYLREWIEFRQDQLALSVKHWAEYCRSIRPDVETILTEGATHVFDPSGQIDYAKFGSHVTFCDPMYYTGAKGLLNSRKWMGRAPSAQFTGCQNVSGGRHSEVFINARSTMLQLVASVLNGSKGTSIYPGYVLDGEDFLLLNRAARFLGENQAFLFRGEPDPVTLMMKLLPREEGSVTLGDGQIARTAYPDWDSAGLHRTYRMRDSDRHLAVIANLNSQEPCFAKVTVANTAGRWQIADNENKTIFTMDGDVAIPSERLAEGIYLRCPKSDFRGFLFSPAPGLVPEGYKRVELTEIEAAYREYSKRSIRAGDGASLPMEERLTFHLDFESGPHATVSAGEGKATVSGELRYEMTPTGKRAAVISGGVSLSYLPEHNINPEQGKIFMRFKPLWHGRDGETHQLFRARPLKGLVYLGKLSDGRLVLNLFDEEMKQHYPSCLVRSIYAGSWHSVTATWNANTGDTMMFLNGEKVSQSTFAPWRMAQVDNRRSYCRLVIPANAEVIIDELKIWDRQ